MDLRHKLDDVKLLERMPGNNNITFGDADAGLELVCLWRGCGPTDNITFGDADADPEPAPEPASLPKTANTDGLDQYEVSVGERGFHARTAYAPLTAASQHPEKQF